MLVDGPFPNCAVSSAGTYRSTSGCGGNASSVSSS